MHAVIVLVSKNRRQATTNNVLVCTGILVIVNADDLFVLHLVVRFGRIRVIRVLRCEVMGKF